MVSNDNILINALHNDDAINNVGMDVEGSMSQSSVP